MSRARLILLAAALLLPGAALAQTDARAALHLRGEYLVTIGLCHDCHTPLVMGPDGPAPDMKRALSGHPQDMRIEAPAKLAQPWTAAASPTADRLVGTLGRELHG